MSKILIENRPIVSSELFDDEVVIVNLENGNYYAYSKSAIDIWPLLKLGVNEAFLIKSFSDKYEFNEKEVTLFTDLIKELKDEGLVIESDKPSDNTIVPEFKKVTFETPSLSKYTDMQDLLLLDPIHDVDETGWPQQKEDIETKKGDV